MKRTILAITIIAMLVSLFVFPTSAADIPAPYADLAFNADGTVYDAAGNTEATFIQVNQGKVAPIEVTLDDGQIYTTWAARLTEAYEIIEFYFPAFQSVDDYTAFASAGFALEIYASYDKFVEKTGGIFGANSSGGIGLLFRGRDATYADGVCHQIMFQIGQDNKDSVLAAGGWANGNYAYCGDDNLGQDNVTDTELLEEHLGKLVHLLATYDPAAKQLRLYFNGVLVQTGTMGDANFKAGKVDWSIMTVGHNGGATYESTVEITPMTVVEARIYNCPISDDQAFAAYTKCREDVILGNNAPAGAGDAPAETEPAPAETEPAPAETEPAAPAETEPAPAETEPAAPAETEPTTPAETEPAPAEGGCGGVIGVGAIVAILGTAVVLKKKEN